MTDDGSNSKYFMMVFTNTYIIMNTWNISMQPTILNKFYKKIVNTTSYKKYYIGSFTLIKRIKI